MENTYRVAKWEEVFVSAECKKLKGTPWWFRMPNKHDSLGFRTVAADAKRHELYSGWCLILQVASKMPVRGVLHNGDRPLTAKDLAIMTGFPASTFEMCLRELSTCEIGWLIADFAGEKARHADTPSSQDGKPAGQDGKPSRQDGTPVIEKRRGEENRVEEKGKGATSAPPTTKRFRKPSLPDLESAFRDRGLPEPEAKKEAQAFLDHFEANGWKVGKALAPMKSWQHAVNTWARNRKQWNTSGHAANNSTSGFSRNAGTYNDKQERLDEIEAYEQRLRSQA